MKKADSTLRSSRAVPHPSTDRALRRLTSEVGRDPVHSTRYGRQRTHCIPRVANPGCSSYLALVPCNVLCMLQYVTQPGIEPRTKKALMCATHLQFRLCITLECLQLKLVHSQLQLRHTYVLRTHFFGSFTSHSRPRSLVQHP